MVRLGGDALDRCRRRIQQTLHGHRGRRDDPLYRARRTLHTGSDLLTDKQKSRLKVLFGSDGHLEVEVTWAIYQRMVAAYRKPDRAQGRELKTALIESLGDGVPKALSEVVTLGRTLKKRAADVLAYFDRPGDVERTHGSHQRQARAPAWLGTRFRNLTHYIARSLLESRGFRPRLHPAL